MRIVFFSDIHANLPALESFFAEMDIVKPDMIYCLGDLVGYNVWPNEVVNEIRKRRIPTIAGNHDESIGNKIRSSFTMRELDSKMSIGAKSNYITNHLVDDDERNYLATLPSHIRLSYKVRDEHINILMVHGSPYDISEYLLENRDEDEMLQIFEDTKTDLLFFGHTHKPYHRVITVTTDNVPAYRHAINVGSVGKPKDGNPHGSYALLTITETTSMFIKESINIQIKRFSYDVSKAATHIEQSNFPNEFADMLRKAY